jgi:hypothetical protein
MAFPRKVPAFAILASIVPAVAWAAPVPTTTAPTTTPALPAPPAPPAPRVSNVLMPPSVVARQGHARFLVGVRTATEARVIVRIISERTKRVVRTSKTTGRHAPGRVWLVVPATSARGFQLAAGRYQVEVYAVDALKRKSNVITRRFGLTLRPPRGALHAYTVPAWPSMIAGVAAAPGGQIIAAVGPDSAPAKAGLQVGDVIRVLNGRAVDNRGGWFAALRQLPGNSPVTVEFDRAGVRSSVQLTPPPDWTAAPDYAPVLAATFTAAPGVRAYRYAQARERLDAKAAATAKTLFAAWPAAERTSAPGEFISGAIFQADGNYLGAMGAYNRALVADPTIGSLQFSRGVAWTLIPNRNDRAIDAFRQATVLDPTDGVSQTFLAFALLRSDRFAEALAAADAALTLDHRYEEARIARGLALLGLTRTAEGVAELKRGLVLVADPARAQQIITASLEPNTR